MLNHAIRTAGVTTLCFILGACAGSRPANLGQINTTLAPCPDKPNCVSSLAPATDEEHFIAPLSVKNETETLKAIQQLIENNPQALVKISSPEYVYAEYTSKWLGFVDDVEFLIGESGSTIEVRSASRLGYADFGVNRARIEDIRNQLAQ